MANYCSIKKPANVSAKRVGNILKSYFKKEFNFDMGFVVEKNSDTEDGLCLVFNDVNMQMWVYQKDSHYKTCVNMYDVSDTCYQRSENENSSYDHVEKPFGWFNTGITFSFLYETVRAVLAKEFKTKVNSDGIGPYDPKESEFYVLKYKNAFDWATAILTKEKENSPLSEKLIDALFGTKKRFDKAKKEEQSLFPEFNK